MSEASVRRLRGGAERPSIASARGVTKVYDVRGVKTNALGGVDLDLAEGEFAALAGPSGSGKTTLLNLLGALDVPTAGVIRIDDEDIATLSSSELSELRMRKLGFVFQAYNLIPVFSARENVEFVMELQGVGAGERKRRALEVLEEVGLGGLGDKRPLEMSGGQQQRVAVARAIVARPRMVLADEPTANLDSETARQLLELMQRLNEEHRVTFLFSTHDPAVMEVAHRLIHLHDGRITREERKAP